MKSKLITLTHEKAITQDNIGEDGFPIEELVEERKVFGEVLSVYGQERLLMDIPLNFEVIKIKFRYGAIRNVNPNGLILTIDGNRYEAVGAFENVNFNNEKAYLKAKRIM